MLQKLEARLVHLKIAHRIVRENVHPVSTVVELLQPLRRICKRNRQMRLSLLDKTVIIRPHLLRDIPAHRRDDLLLRDRATVHLMPERTRDRLPQNHPRPFL